jgi:hypothetical protein
VAEPKSTVSKRRAKSTDAPLRTGTLVDGLRLIIELSPGIEQLFPFAERLIESRVAYDGGPGGDASDQDRLPGELFLLKMMHDAAHETAPDVLKNDASAVLKWLGADSANDIKAHHYEKFALGFVQYRWERTKGTAPSKRLARVFAECREYDDQKRREYKVLFGRAKEALSAARSQLVEWAQAGKIHGHGSPHQGSPITEWEWQTRRIQIYKNRLIHPVDGTRETFPWITAVKINLGDVERLAAHARLKKRERGRPPEYKWNDVLKKIEERVSREKPVQSERELFDWCAEFAADLDPENNVPDDSTIRAAIAKYGLAIAAALPAGK